MPNISLSVSQRVGLFVLCVFAASCQSGPKLEKAGADDFKLVSKERSTFDWRHAPIVPGETLDIYVIEDPSLNGQYTVRAEGHIIFPGMGRVVLQGLSPDKAEGRLKELLQARKLREATVLLDRVASKAPPLAASTDQILVYLTGKVAKPGQHALTVPLSGSMGAYEAVMITGGVLRFANERKAYVLRRAPAGENKRKIAVDLKAVSEGSAPDLPLRMGDIVYVPEKTFGF